MKLVRAGVATVTTLIIGFASVANATSFPTCTISAPPGPHYTGHYVRLLWVSQDATSATISTIGAIPPGQVAQGFRDIYLTGNTLITMTVGNGTGTRTCSALISLSNLPVTTQAQPIYQQTSVYQPITFSSTQVQYVPALSYSSRPQQEVWTPFWDSSPTTYGYAYDSYRNESLYYSGNYYDRYESFYDTASGYPSDYNDTYIVPAPRMYQNLGDQYGVSGIIRPYAGGVEGAVCDSNGYCDYGVGHEIPSQAIDDYTPDSSIHWYDSGPAIQAPPSGSSWWDNTPPPRNDTYWNENEGSIQYYDWKEPTMRQSSDSYDI